VLAYYASRDLVPLYSVYALLFGDHGLSAAEISTLFLIWSLASFLFEVPSGAWADLVDRRRLLVASAFVQGAGFAGWTLGGGFLAYATGFVLWALSGALASGTFEALVYDELKAQRREDHYPRLVGWAESAAMTANLLASVSAAPLFALGGYPLVGWASVATALLQAVLAATLPVGTGRRHGAASEVVLVTERVLVRYVDTLRAGIREAAGHSVVRRAVLVAAFVVGTAAYDEYFPLVARDHQVATEVVPWLIGLTVLGQVVGTALAGRAAALPSSLTGWTVVAAGVLISLGVLVMPWAGFAAVALGYGLLNNAMVVTEARLQQVIAGSARATVTSVLGLGEELVALTVFASFGLASGVVSVPVLVALLGVPTVMIGLGVRRWLPEPNAEPTPER